MHRRPRSVLLMLGGLSLARPMDEAARLDAAFRPFGWPLLARQSLDAVWRSHDDARAVYEHIDGRLVYLSPIRGTQQRLDLLDGELIGGIVGACVAGSHASPLTLGRYLDHVVMPLLVMGDDLG